MAQAITPRHGDRDNLRYLLLACMPAGKCITQRQQLFNIAERISSWHHAVIGRFRHLCQCTELLDGQDRYAVLSILGMEQDICNRILLEADSAMNMSRTGHIQVIRATEKLMMHVLKVRKENCLVFQPVYPYSPCTPRPYTECQLRNLILYYTMERREQLSQCVNSIASAVAETIYAYHQLCLAITTLDNHKTRRKALQLTAIDPETFSQTLNMLNPFYQLREDKRC